MTFRRRWFPVLCSVGAAILGSAILSAQSGDTEKNYPNLLRPLYEFGRANAETAALRLPSSLAIGKDDRLYVADSGNHRIQIFGMNGRLLGSFGRCGRAPSEFIFPSAIAAADDGEIFVADGGSGRLQRFTPEGKFLSAWEGLKSPRGIAIAGDRVYVSEGEAHRIRILSRKGGETASFGGLGSQPGRFNTPAGVAVDEKGSVYVADSGNHRIQKLDPDGKPLAQWGAWGAQAGLMSYPTGLATSAGRVYVADRANHRVQVFDLTGALIRQWGAAPVQPGEGAGRFHFPEGISVSSSGGLTAVCEPLENRVQVFVNRDLAPSTRVNDMPWWDSLHARLHSLRLAPPPPGAPPQKAGVLAASDVHAVFLFDISSNALGPVTTAGGFGWKLGELNGIGGAAVDPNRDRVYVSDRGNRRIVTYEVQRSAARREIFTGLIRVIGSFSMARLVPSPPPEYLPDRSLPGPLSVDGQGRLYVLDRGNAAVVVCDSDFKFLSLVPVPPTVQDMAVGSDGTIYVSDPAAFQARVYGPDGKLKRSFGRGDGKADDGFLMPSGIAVDDQGFVYVVDGLQDCIKKFDAEGRFVKRWGASGQKPDQLAAPRGLAFSRPDRLIIEDLGNHRAQVCTTQGDWIGSYVSGGLTTPIAIR